MSKSLPKPVAKVPPKRAVSALAQARVAIGEACLSEQGTPTGLPAPSPEGKPLCGVTFTNISTNQYLPIQTA